MFALLLAQASDSGLGSTLAPWANLTAVGALIFFLGWIIVKEVPKQRESQEKRDQTFADALAHVIARGEAQQHLQRVHDEKQTDRLERKLDDVHDAVTHYTNGRAKG